MHIKSKQITLTNLRQQVNNIDRNIIKQIACRQLMIKQIAKYKEQHSIAIHDDERENILYAYHQNIAHKHQVNKKLIANIFRLLIKFAKYTQNNLKQAKYK